MLITDIETIRIRLPLDPPFPAAWDPVPRQHFDATLVVVTTDEGIVGIGSGDTMDGFETYKHLFVGTDPTRIAQQVSVIETAMFHGGRYWPLEVALWDIVGQSLNQPVSKLLGNSVDSVPAYASLGAVVAPERRGDDALMLKEMGFRALKLRIEPNRLEVGLLALSAIRNAVGASMEIMVDLNQGWRMAGDVRPPLDVAGAKRAVAQIADFDPLWIEEPIDGNDIAGMKELRASTSVRIAGGEMIRTVSELQRAVEEGALDVVQPDVVLSLGIYRAAAFAQQVKLRNRWFTPHTWTNGIGLLANLAVTAGVGGGPFLEFPFDPGTWTPDRRDFMLLEPVSIQKDGTIAVPQRPGIGGKLDMERIKRLKL